MARDGVTPEVAKAAVRRSNTLISTLMLRRGEADGMLCGLVGRFDAHLAHVRDVIGAAAPARRRMAAMNALMMEQHTLFIADTFVNEEPGAEQLADIALMAAAEVRRFGMPPKVAFLSHSIFGSSLAPRGTAHARGARPVRAARPRHRVRRRDARRRGAVRGTVRRGYLPETHAQRQRPTCWCCRTWTRPTSCSTCSR